MLDAPAQAAPWDRAVRAQLNHEYALRYQRRFTASPIVWLFHGAEAKSVGRAKS